MIKVINAKITLVMEDGKEVVFDIPEGFDEAMLKEIINRKIREALIEKDVVVTDE